MRGAGGEGGDRLATLDLESGFHHVSIHPESRDLLGFEWKGTWYRWTVLPFGLCSSPYVFCKTMRVLLQALRAHGHRVNGYVDDILAASASATTGELADILTVCHSMGVHVNLRKSCLEWRMEQEYLGLLVSCLPHTPPQLRVPRDRLRNTLREARRLLGAGRSGTSLPARRVAQVTGQLVSLTRAIFPARLHLRGLYRAIKSRSSWRSPVTLGPDALANLEWWTATVAKWNGRSLLPTPRRWCWRRMRVAGAGGRRWASTRRRARSRGRRRASHRTIASLQRSSWL